MIVEDIVQEDLRVTWNKENVEEMVFAENIFSEYIHQGWIAIGEVSGKNKQSFTFDPDI